MKKSILLLVAIVTLNQSLWAQEKRAAGKLFYSEMGGPGVILSANFDSRFKPNERLGFGYRIGAGFGVGEFQELRIDRQRGTYHFNQVTKTYYSFPAGLNYVFGTPDEANTFEVGASVTILSHRVSLYSPNEEKAGRVIGCISFMYRMAPVNSGFSFRIGFTPMIGTSGEPFPIMGAVGIGYAF